MFAVNSYIVDTTLRDGEQAPGVVFTIQEKHRIAELLNRVGIPELEVGVPAMGKAEMEDVKSICKAGYGFKTLAWSRATKEDIDITAKTGADSINISFPVSDIQLEAIGKNRGWVMQNVTDIVNYAQAYFPFVAIGAQDASRANKFFLFDFVKKLHDLKVNRVRIADTVGILNPMSTSQLISSIALGIPDIQIEFHPHNDLGMAAANALTALHSGAHAISGTVNGLGERAGNAPIEEVIMALEKSMNIKTGYRLSELNELSHCVEQASGRTLSLDKPISGKLIMTHETGIHTRSIIVNNRSYELFDAEEIGRKSEFMYGKFSGKAALQHLFERKGIAVCQKGVAMILAELKELSSKNKKSYTENEVLEMFISAIR